MPGTRPGMTEAGGKVTVPHPRRDLHPKTVKSIYRQAALKERR